jgi:alpha-L-rhamnosidase
MKRLLMSVIPALVCAGCAMAAQYSATSMADADEWKGKWIQAPWSTERDGAELDGSRPMPVFRREFVLQGRPVKAELRIAGLGQYVATLDGVEVEPEGLHQAWTDYRKTVTYDAFDITKKLSSGEHVIGVILGNGMYNVQRTAGRFTKFEGSFGAPMMIAELRVMYAGGASEVIASDDSWKVAKGPVMFSSTYGGEDFDARKVQAGWERVGFRDATWTAAKMVDGPGGMMVPAIAPDVRATEMPGAPQMKALNEKSQVYDFGQNFAGWPHVVVNGPTGAVLKLTPGELLNPDGSVSQKSSGDGPRGAQWWSYTLRGDKEETWEPRFSYYGFRYLQVEWVGDGAAAVPGKILRVAAERLTSDSPATGSFASSNEMLNAIHKLIVEAMHNNEVSVFTDCPHREKLGWLEETHLVASGLMFNNDLHGLYAATAKNIRDAQHENGTVPTIAPQYTMFGPKYPIYDDSPEWGSASILATWNAYRFYGDTTQLERNYSTMKAYLQFLESRATDGIVAYGLGDWYDIGPGEPGFSKLTTAGVTGTLMLYEDAVAMQKIATLLGHADDGVADAALADREKDAFNRRFWDAANGYYDKGSQTANAMPLALGIVPEDKRAAVLEHVVSDIHAHEEHVTTGEVGYPYLLRVLMEDGRNDVLLAMMLRKDPPSYGSQLAAGATALTEAWDANPKNSQDHLMLGGAEEWFYRGLGGIDFDLSREDAAEWITIRPRVVDGVSWVRCGFDSKLGKIESDWRVDGLMTFLDVTVPQDATLIVPLRRGEASVMIEKTPAEKAAGVTLIRRNATSATFHLRSGTYHFDVTNLNP